jgi:glycosyltransferase involved in cell wall biosynthesis
MPEIVRHGGGGYLVHGLDEAVAAVHASGDMDRLAVRASVEQRFDVDRMVDEYLDVYRRVIEDQRAGRKALEADAGQPGQGGA